MIILNILQNPLCVTIICDYLDNNECYKYLQSVEKLNEFGYLCLEYKEHITENTQNNIHKLLQMNSTKRTNNRQIKYLRDKLYTHNLCEYTNLRTLRMSPYFDEPLTHGMFSDNIHTLMFGVCFNQIILPNTLPNNLKKLVLGWCYKHTIIKGALPYGLKVLILQGTFNLELDEGVIPETVEELVLSHSYNHEFKQNVLPPNLNTYCSGFPNVYLPNTIEEMTFRGNCCYDTYIPPSVKIIKFANETYNVKDLRNRYPHIKIIIL
jgi:hypothetical protein